MTMLERLAEFVERASWDAVSAEARARLGIHLLDSLACALGALGGDPIRRIRGHLADFGGAERATLIGGGRTAPDRAAFYNAALVRYLDFNDSYLAKGETCHPSDNVGAVLAAADYARASGRDLLAALAVAYQVQCRLSDEAPVRAKGFDHTVQGQCAAAAGVAKALGLDRGRIAHAISISATAHNALRVTRTGSLSHWKGLAYPETAFTATHSAFLAMRGITGPPELFEGNKGWMQSITGEFELDWEREGLERVQRVLLKRFNAEIHSQPTLEAVLELRKEHGIEPASVERIEVDTFDVAFHIIGGGEEGDKRRVRTKEEADHSLPYMVAVALLDGQVLPEQYREERIRASDVQSLLRKILVRARPELSAGFPDRMPCVVRIVGGGRTLERRQDDYKGFPTRPMGWDDVVEKLERLGGEAADGPLRRDLVQAVRGLDGIQASDLLALLARVRAPDE